MDTLVRLRWLAITGQALAVLLVWLGLRYEFEAVLCLILVGLSAWLNLYLQFQFPKSLRLTALPATGLLAYDTAQLAGLLFLTGGLQNPFAILLLVPAVVSATTLPARFTVFQAAFITLIATLLAFFHQPLPWIDSNPPDLPALYVTAIWVAIVLTMLFLGMYAFRIAQENQLLANALSATELILANEQHLSNLDGLATAAAHELGTPLSTIQLVSKELVRELEADDPIRDDVDLLHSQAERCKEILGKLRSLSGDEHSNFSKMRLTALVSEIVEPFELLGIDIVQTFPQDDAGQPVLWRNPGIIYGLGNLVENAVDFAQSRVEIESRWTDKEVLLRIVDDGPGFSDAIMHRLGDPYVTSRGARFQAARENLSTSTADRLPQPAINGGGLGLGFFIAKTLLERSGAKVTIANKRSTDTDLSTDAAGGAIIDIHWPRRIIEADQ